MSVNKLFHIQFSRKCLIFPLFVLSTYAYTSYNAGCNEGVCGSIVSKCMLTQSCKCDAKNVSCSKDCFYCLDKLYLQCCSCVEMCPKANESENFLSATSHVEDLNDPFVDLFSVLTEEKDRLLRWTSYTYPAELSIISMDKEVKLVTSAKAGESEPVTVNCTVAYMSQCTSWHKCKSSCQSMGASSYRWFHDGCCECVGSTCLNYGINESRCLDCPDKDQMTLEELNVVSKDSEKGDEEFTEEKDEDVVDTLAEREEGFDYMQSIES